MSVLSSRCFRLGAMVFSLVVFFCWENTIRCQEGDCELDASLSLEASPPLADGAEFRIQRGENFELNLTALVETHFDGDWGVQGFSLSVAHDEDVLEITGATQDGTDAASVFPLAFERTETVENETGAGFICAVVLSLANPVTLPPEGTFSLVRASYLVSSESIVGDAVSTSIEFRDGLRGSGQPVSNRLTWNGKTIRPCSSPLSIRLRLTGGEDFIRGDSDQSGALDITDAIGTISYLFLGDGPPACLDAADVNDDGRVDIGDPVFCLNFLFRGGREPPAPFPVAGADPTGDDLTCSSPGA